VPEERWFGAIVFRWLINTVTHIAFSGGARVLSFLSEYYVVLIPAMGGLFVGPSESGKTTLLNLIGYLDKPTSGSLEVAGVDVT
jgi:ABC-type lipoprotein export system ATPase subunit